MPGGFDPAPFTFGAAGSVRPEELFLDALLEADGSALSKEVGSFVWAERCAEARVLAYAAGVNRRLASLWDPLRLTSTLERWETILQIAPPPTLTPVERRARVAAHFARYGLEPNGSALADLLSAAISDIYGSIVRTPAASAAAAVPGGATPPGGVTYADGSWFSTVAYLAVEVRKPDAMTEGHFYALAGEVFGLIDGFVPAWTTFDWFRDGPSGAGFYLDDEHNLDNERFD